jgi:hypothetical protein
MHKFHKFILAWKLCTFRTVPLSIIRRSFTVHLAMLYVIQVCRQLSSRNILALLVQWMNSWWWTKELSETCRLSCQNKFVKLVHLVGFIINKFVWTVVFIYETNKRSEISRWTDKNLSSIMPVAGTQTLNLKSISQTQIKEVRFLKI